MTKRKLLAIVELGDASDHECNACPWKRQFGYTDGAPFVCTNEAIYAAERGIKGVALLPDEKNQRLAECIEAEDSGTAVVRAHARLIAIGSCIDNGREYNEDVGSTLARIEAELER